MSVMLILIQFLLTFLVFAETTINGKPQAPEKYNLADPVFENITCILSINSQASDNTAPSSFTIYHQGQLTVPNIFQRISQMNNNPYPVVPVGCFTSVFPHELVSLFSGIEQVIEEICEIELISAENGDVHKKLHTLSSRNKKSCRIKIQQHYYGT